MIWGSLRFGKPPHLQGSCHLVTWDHWSKVKPRLCGHLWQLTFRWFMRLYEFVNCHVFFHGLVTDSLWIRYYWKVDGPCIPKCQLHFQHVMSLYDVYIYMINSMFSCIGFNTLKNCQVLLTLRNLWSIHVCDSFPWLFWFPVTQPWQTMHNRRGRHRPTIYIIYIHIHVD
jgi:hypothetical protein